MKLWAVQYVHGGVPEDPEVFTDQADALRRYADLGVLNGLEFDPETETFEGEDNDVYWWEVETRSGRVLAADGGRELTPEQAAEADRIAGVLIRSAGESA